MEPDAGDHPGLSSLKSLFHDLNNLLFYFSPFRSAYDNALRLFDSIVLSCLSLQEHIRMEQQAAYCYSSVLINAISVNSRNFSCSSFLSGNCKV